MDLSSRILFIDGEAIVIDKPAGLPVAPPRNGGLSLDNYLSHLTMGFQKWPEPVHRLDRDTSGCLLLARNLKALKRFGAAFEHRRVGKRYLAVLDGHLEDDSGTIDLALAKISSAEAGWRMVPDPTGKAAVTHWQRIAEIDGKSLVSFTPETGRTHQIRVHALHGLGAPVAGDPVYGDSTGAMLLHSEWIKVERDNKPPVEATAPVPPTFAQAGFDVDALRSA